MWTVGDYSIFIQDWTEPEGGIHGYLARFLASGDPTFQHIAIWTLLQLLESGDKRLVNLISRAEDVVSMVRMIADRSLSEIGGGGGGGGNSGEHGDAEGEGDDESEDGERDVIALAQRSLELLGYGR